MEKKEKYEQLLVEVNGLVSSEFEVVGNLANVSALIREKMGFFWIGFYMVGECTTTKEKELKLGPFQGPVACFKIGWGRGVCGTSWKENKTYVVNDVEEFPGHIACSSLSRSEIVVPLHNSGGEVVGVLDIDSTEVGTFDSVDKQYLEQLCEIVSKELF